MDPLTMQSLTAQLTNNPMNLLEIPESIFEVFESPPEEELISSEYSSVLHSPDMSRRNSELDLLEPFNFQLDDLLEEEARFGPPPPETDKFDDLLNNATLDQIPNHSSDSIINPEHLSNLDPVIEENLKTVVENPRTTRVLASEIFPPTEMLDLDDAMKTITISGQSLPKRPSVQDFFEVGESSSKKPNGFLENETISFEWEFLESVQTLSPKRSRNFSESSVSSSRCSSRLSGKAKTKKKAKRENVLHFLKRMLDDETNEIIVWKDKERGIFFIADRDGLLEAWKETKGRSASNWNNFAKTLRTHYKKPGNGPGLLRPMRKQYTWRFSSLFLQ